MLTAHRWLTVKVCVGLGVCVGLAGCRREEPAEPTKAPVPKIPVSGEAAKPSTPKPAIPKPVFAQPTSLPGAVSAEPGASATAPAIAADQMDAPDAPPFFPKSRAVSGWEKDGPIRTALPGELDELLDEKVGKAVRPYQIKKVAACAYRWTKGTRPRKVRLVLIETHQPEDAYGIFTVLGAGKQSESSGQVARSETNDKGRTTHVWKGRHYLRLTVPGKSDPRLTEASDDLFRKITFAMPDAPRPALVEALPRAGLVDDGHWLIRRWASLAGPGAAALEVPADLASSKTLGLDRDSQMVIATYKIPGAARLHRIWVVRYDTPEQARQAHKRYRALLDKAGNRASASTMLLSPQGRYLLGTWTAEEESLGPVLPKLRGNLG